MSDEEEKVGYKNPPRHTQFKPRQSGNPKGRPRKQKKSFKEYVLRELEQKIPVTENGKRCKITKRAAIIKSLINDFAHSDTKLTTALINLLGSVENRVQQKQQQIYYVSWLPPQPPLKADAAE